MIAASILQYTLITCHYEIANKLSKNCMVGVSGQSLFYFACTKGSHKFATAPASLCPPPNKIA